MCVLHIYAFSIAPDPIRLRLSWARDCVAVAGAILNQMSKKIMGIEQRTLSPSRPMCVRKIRLNAKAIDVVAQFSVYVPGRQTVYVCVFIDSYLPIRSFVCHFDGNSAFS